MKVSLSPHRDDDDPVANASPGSDPAWLMAFPSVLVYIGGRHSVEF